MNGFKFLAVAALLAGVVTSTAFAGHDYRPVPQGGHARLKIGNGFVIGIGVNPKVFKGHRPYNAQYRRGYDAGSRAGWRAGYRDARHGGGFHPVVNGCPRARSRQFVGGYHDAWARAYRRGYRAAQLELRRNRWRRHRPAPCVAWRW